MAMQILLLSYSFHITFLSFTKIENFDSETSIIIYQHLSIFKLKNLKFFLICFKCIFYSSYLFWSSEFFRKFILSFSPITTLISYSLRDKISHK